ncbi:MAG: InlB B-repeat-containing protein [Kiritimatiellae bacterium]|nr:InlB B-repeat-containing protein [Kiritimatiellia bacterium]
MKAIINRLAWWTASACAVLALAAPAAYAEGAGVATVTLGRLSQTYDGTAKTVTVATEPEGLAVVVTYDGRAEAPTEAGSHAVRAEVADPAWMGAAEGVLKISKAAQTISFDAIRTQRPSDTVVLDATASSGLAVGYTVEGPAVLDGNVLSFTGEGTVRVVARQAGNGNWKAAASETRVFEVREPVRPVRSGPFALDTRNGMREAGETERIAYSTEWTHGGSVRVAVDGTVLLEADAPASGEVVWNAAGAGAGVHTLTHESGGGTLTAVFAVGRDVATVTLGGLAQVYDGTAKTVEVATVPEGLAVAVTYDGSAEAPTEAGSHAVRAEVVDGAWVGSSEGVLEIAKAAQTIEFAEIGVQTVTDTVVLDATASSGLAVSYAVDGPAVAAGNVLTFTGPGMVRVVASQAGNGNWAAAADVERVFGVGMATVTLGRLSQTYDGTAKTVTVATEPEGLAVVVTYDGRAEAPTEAGSHAVRAEVVDPAWMGAAEGVLKISKATQTISFDAIRTQRPSDTVVLDATASSGLEVGYTVEGPAVLDGNVLSFTGEGTVRVVARQEGNGNWKAAASETRVFEVREPVLPVRSEPFALDTRSGTRVAGETERIAYSTEWTHGGSVRVAVDGTVLLEADAPASGEVVWIGLEAGGGLHTLTHESGGVTLTAVFRVECQEVAFHAAGGTCPVVSARFPKGGTYAHLPDAERDGYPFLGWFSAAEGGSRVLEGTPVTEEDARTLYAHWGQTVRFDPNGGTCARRSVTCCVGGTYAHFAIPVREGFKFLGWYDAPEGGTRVRVGHVVTDQPERTLWAHWERLRQTVRFNANGGTCTKKSVKCFVGDAYAHFAIPVREGYKFLGWYDAQEGGIRVRVGQVVTDQAERTLWAHWERLRQTVRFDANGGTCAKASVKCFVGDAYAHFAIPVREGFKFKGWYDAKEGGQRVRVGMTVTADAERTLYAHWQATAAALSITGFSRTSRPVSAVRDARVPATECTLRVDAPAGIPCEIQWTPSLGADWTVLRRWTPAADGETSVPVVLPADSPAGFFRVVGADADNE